MKKAKLMLGDNIQSLKKLPDNSIDSVVSDPPYGLSFMGKKWDYDVPSVDFWKEVYRVLKPGGHILSFGGTRTYHRMVVNIEDAGFEIRDQIQWLYGSGFPKSLNVGKSVDKLEGNVREIVGISKAQRLNKRIDVPNINMNGREVVDTKGQSEWEGWGSALKPANEPICLARKPLSEKSIAENVLKWKTGGLNIDGCRIVYKSDDDISGWNKKNYTKGKTSSGFIDGLNNQSSPKNEEGRFPANLILDESAAEMLDEQSGISKSVPDKRKTKNDVRGVTNFSQGKLTNHNDSGGASRFFYIAKVSKAERNMGLDGFEDKETNATNQNWRCLKCDKFQLSGNGDVCNCNEPEWKSPINKNHHPTVKPINLMSYLCKLITPTNGIVLDPFMGSGSTGIAALLNDFRFVGMEMDSDYFKISEARINNYKDYKKFLKK